MIESLAEHGVTPEDLAPALMTTHTIENPEYDEVEAKRQEETEREVEESREAREEKVEGSGDVGDASLDVKAIEARFANATGEAAPMATPAPPPHRESANEDETDIADLVGSVTLRDSTSGMATPMGADTPPAPTESVPMQREEPTAENPLAMGKALPGVSTTLSKTDRNVTLDIRWTVVSCRVSHPWRAALTGLHNSSVICSCS